ncbi:uncharacterized protein LOC132398701 isoform X4 [Hypanus sabinus]|uniref:uncharacterized protein LOC132398701 isoform X4 n=1 Tax=Hypanus sabinus TaxID=79690 RepID=UPI0028C4A8B7|nr:uncharacterized protein LOC132398701 isoform X4 [Hypanus sabinus]
MRPYDVECPPRHLHHWAPRDCSKTKKGRVLLCVRDNSQHLLSLGLGRKKTWLYGRQHEKPPLPLTHGKRLQRPSHSSASVCLSKAGLRYFTFVSRVRLWDRVQTHNPSHLQADPDGTSLPCPRFLAHMNTLSNSPPTPWDFMNAPRTHYPEAIDREPRTSTREIRTSAAHYRHRYPAKSFCHLQFKRSSKPQPKSPPASEKSSGEDEERTLGTLWNTLAGSSEQKPAEESDANRGCEHNEEFWSESEWKGPGMDEVDVLRQSFSTLQLGSESTSAQGREQALNVSRQGFEFNLDRDNDETAAETWDRPTNSRTGSSTDLSQLRCSSISWDSRVSTGSTVPGGSIAPSETHLRNTSRLVTSGLYHSFVSLGQTARDGHCTGDLLRESSSAASQSPMERNPSFVEIWHDRLLNHWPVLPPISPQTGSLDDCSRGSGGGVNHSYSDLSAYEELDEIIQRTGSSSSHHTLRGTAEDVSDSELIRRSSFSQTTSSWADETLAEARLSLLDHQVFIQHWDTNQLGEQLTQAAITESTEAMAGGVAEEDDGRSKINAGSLAPRPASSSPAQAPTPTHRTNKDDVDLDCLTTADDLSHKAAQSSRTIPSPCSAPVVQALWAAAHPEKVHQSEVNISPGEKGQGSSPPPAGSVSAVTPNLSPASSRRNARTLVAGRGRWVSRDSSGDLLSGEMSRPRQEPRARGLRTFRKPWMVESHRQSSPVVTSVSDIREKMLCHCLLLSSDFTRRVTPAISNTLQLFLPGISSCITRTAVNFLEKYCIFNQEDLALYKKKFQEVDNNNDGYLSCAELVTALKEMVPLGALTDSEEIYIYRILESLDYRVTDGLMDLRLFTVMVSLAQKITALDGFMRSLIGNMDLKALDLKLYRAKQLFLCSLEAGSNTISVEQLLVELKAGRISSVHEEKVRQELQHSRELDLLDFLTYLPLFILIHNSVVSNPLDNTPTL